MLLHWLHPQLLLSLICLLRADTNGGSGCYPESAACRLYGDCCHTVPDRRAAMAPGLSCEDPNSAGIQLPTDSGIIGPGGWDRVQLVQTCPTNADPDAAERCHSQKQRLRSLFDPRLLPAMSQDGLLFRTAHCALCNGRKRLLRPQVTVLCVRNLLILPPFNAIQQSNSNASSADQLSQYLAEELQSGRDLPDGCMVGTRFPDGVMHQCQLNAIAHCTNSSATETQRRSCEDGGVSLVWDECDTFRNPACRDCYYGDCRETGNNLREPPSVLSNAVNFWIPLNELGLTGHGNILHFDIWADSGSFNNDSSASSSENSTAEASQMFGPQQVVLIVSYGSSILSLILLLTVYAVLPHLRNRAGQLLMSHSASVMALQSVQLLSMCAGSLLGAGCMPLTFLFYFCLVSAFVWAFLFGWDLLRTFASLLRNSAFKPSRYGRFALIGWGLPLILTGTLVGLHLGIGLLDTDHQCRYRSDRVAFMVGLSFAPLAAALTFNAVIVCLLAAQLVKTFRETRTASQSSASKLCIMTAKVSVIMGITWFPYFLIILIDRGRNSDTAGFAGELLCSLHGVFLAIGFTGNRRVWAKLSRMKSSVQRTFIRAYYYQV